MADKMVRAWGVRTSWGISTDTSWTKRDAMEAKIWPWDKIVRVEIREVKKKKE